MDQQQVGKQSVHHDMSPLHLSRCLLKAGNGRLCLLEPQENLREQVTAELYLLPLPSLPVPRALSRHELNPGIVQ